MTSNNKEYLWVEKYRPKTIDDCILPESIKITFKQMVDSVREAEKAIGTVNYPLEKQEAKRCLIVVRDVKRGDLFSDKNIKSLRPGGGIEPKYFDQIINHYEASRNILKGALLQWDMVKEK